jgi:surfeit locus 1 family protein
MITGILRLMFSRRWWWTTLLVIAGIGIAIRLGFWQLDRNAQRLAQISHIQSVQAMPVLDLDQRPLTDDLVDMEYRPVTVTGVYDFDHQVVLRNQVRSRMTGTDPGIALLTPLIMDDGQAVLVERGWIPLDYTTPDSWRQFDQPGTVEVQGVLRRSLDKGEMGSTVRDPTLTPGESHLDYWNFINLPRLQEQLLYPLLDVYIQQASGPNPESLPHSLLEQPDLNPGDHIGFALQWFFYAGLVFVGYPVWLKKQKNPSQNLEGTSKD